MQIKDENFIQAMLNYEIVNSDKDWIKLIKQDLPNFPDEVIEDFLLEYAITDSWPPVGSSWWGRMRYKTLSDWRNYKWEKIDLDLSNIKLGEEFNIILKMLTESCVEGRSNIYSQRLGIMSKKRFDRIKQYMLSEKVFPKPIILIRENSEYDIFDGSHRFTVWNHLYNLDLVKSIQTAFVASPV